MMMPLRSTWPGLCLIGFAFVLLSACTDNPTAGTSETAKTPGQEIFLNNCMGCHMGSGDPPAPNDVVLRSNKLASEETFRAFVRQPGNGSMPPFSAEQLSDSDVGKLFEYLKSIH